MNVVRMAVVLAVIVCAAPCAAPAMTEDERNEKIVELLVKARACFEAGNREYAETLCDAALFLDSLNPIANAMKREILTAASTEWRSNVPQRVRWFDDDAPMRLFREFNDRANGRLAPYEPVFLQH